ncbi:hypothetical protein N7513_009222 [Penicillium frequentans]|nr:hypothetical protein N7513_009222 [Penicillium glabrum]
MSQRPETPETLLDLASLFYRAASWYASWRNIVGDMIEFASKPRKYRLNLLGANNTAVLESKTMLAFAYQKLGRSEEFMQLQVQAMETRKLKFGEDDLPTLKSMAPGLVGGGRAAPAPGRHAEAINLMRQCLEEREQILGLYHQDTREASDALLAWKSEELNNTP